MSNEHEDRSPRSASGTRDAGDADRAARGSDTEDRLQSRDAVEAQCPLCGHRFEPGENPACAHCPKLFATCGMIMCPNCSHEFPR